MTSFNNSSDVDYITTVTSEENQTLQEEDYVMDYFDVDARFDKFIRSPQHMLSLAIALCGVAANILCACAVLRIRHVWTNLHYFMFSLLTSDLLVACSVCAHSIRWIVSPLHRLGVGPWDERLTSRCWFLVISGLHTLGLNVTLFNLMGMAVDHYVAIMRPLHYVTAMTKRRSIVSIALIWSVAIFLSFIDFLSPVWHSKKKSSDWSSYNYCERVYETPHTDEYTTLAIAGVCFIVMLYVYGNIYVTVRHKQRAQEGMRASHLQPRRKRNIRALVTTLLILGSFMICWFPQLTFQLTLNAINKLQPELLHSYSDKLIPLNHAIFAWFILNCILDPLIYTLRMGEIRLGMRSLLSACPCTRFWRSMTSPSKLTSVSLLSERRGTQELNAADEEANIRPIVEEVSLRDVTVLQNDTSADVMTALTTEQEMVTLK